jgi:hypothetical protein
MANLDLIGIRAGTDKSRLRQDYLRHYQRMFSRFADQWITVMEIGIHQGASLRVWEQFFPKAMIVGVDIEPQTARFARDRVNVEIGSQYDAGFLRKLASKYVPSIIVDDGSHVAEHQVFTFNHLFGSIPAGGVYVVEDLSGSHGDLAVDHFVQLQQAVLQRRGPADISHCEMIPGAIAFWKRSDPDEWDGNFAALKGEADRSERSSEALLYLAEYMRRHGAPLEDALEVARESSKRELDNVWIRFEIAQILHAMGREAEAVAVLAEAVQMRQPPIEVMRNFLARWSGAQ